MPFGPAYWLPAPYQRSRTVPVLTGDCLDGLVRAESAGLSLDYDGVCVFDRGEGVVVLFLETEGALVFQVDCVIRGFPVQVCRVVQHPIGAVEVQWRVGSFLPVVRMVRGPLVAGLCGERFGEPGCPDLGMFSPESSAAFCHQCRWSPSLPGFGLREMVCNGRF